MGTGRVPADPPAGRPGAVLSGEFIATKAGGGFGRSRETLPMNEAVIIMREEETNAARRSTTWK